MSKIDFEKLIFLSSVQLNQLDAQGMPVGFASGAMINYSNKHLLLTVSHATGNNKNWAIQLKYVPGNGTLHHQLGTMNFLVEVTLDKPKFNDIDFSYVDIPESIIAYRQEIEFPNKIKSELPISTHQTNLTDIPCIEENYGFCGMILPTYEEHFGQKCVGGELRTYQGLKYLRTEDDYHIFKLPFDHPGSKFFEGCSGAPIINEAGCIVGLLCESCIETNEIYAISLSKYKIVIDIHVGNIE